jgi:plasmid stabilization system protein ParE
MPRLIRSPAALGDVQRAYRFLLDKNPAAAKQAVLAIREQIKCSHSMLKLADLQQKWNRNTGSGRFHLVPMAILHSIALKKIS